MKKSYLLSVLISFLATSTICQSSYLTDFKQKWNNAKTYTLQVAELMPEAYYDYRPTNDQMSFKDQLLHIQGNMMWLSTSYLGIKKPEKSMSAGADTKEQVIKVLTEGFELAEKAIDQLEVANLDEVVQFFAGPMHKRQILTLMNDHLTHHRGQLIVYLRLKGVKPPRYLGW